MPKKIPQTRKFVKNLPQELSDSSPDASPEKKRSRPSWLDPTSSEEETEPIFQPPPPTRISENDPLFKSRPSTSRQEPPVTDEEWQEMMRMTRKEVPGIKIPSPPTARRRRQKLRNQVEARRLFNEGIYKTAPSPKKLDHEKFDQLLKGMYVII